MTLRIPPALNAGKSVLKPITPSNQNLGTCHKSACNRTAILTEGQEGVQISKRGGYSGS